MTSDMAEGGSRTPKKYSCACGLSQDYRRKPFSGKCRHCHTRLKFLREQSSFDSGSASIGCTLSPSEETLTIQQATAVAPTPGRTHRNELRSHAEGSKTLHRPFQNGRRTGTQARVNSEASHNNRRRSRSVDRYMTSRITAPPPYQISSDVPHVERRPERSRRSGSEGPTRRRKRGGVGPPPSYDDAQNYFSNPPSYEEALANSMSSLSTDSSISSLIASSPSLRNNSAVSREYFNAPGPALRDNQEYSAYQADVPNTRRDELCDRYIQRQREREIQEEIEQTRLREIQMAQYCGCSKCQSLYYHYCYDESMNDAPTFPMETQVVMQEVLADGLAFCSLM